MGVSLYAGHATHPESTVSIGVSVSDAHCVCAAHGVEWTVSRSLELCACVGEVGESTSAGSV